MIRRWPSVRQTAVSLLLVLAGVCLVAGVVMAIASVVHAADDPAVSAGEYILAVVMGLLLYGPEMVVTLWPITIPVIAVLGLGLAYLWSRRDSEPAPAAGVVRVARVVLLGYAGVLGVTWIVWLLNAR